MIKAIIYDYDGVISDSVNIKTEAFANLYNKYGEEVKVNVIKYHLEHGGISRYEKFKYFHKFFLGIELREEEVNELATEFSRIVFEKVTSAKYIDGAYDFIKINKDKYFQFICTGTPAEEINLILQKRAIDSFFHKIRGAPQDKKEIIAELLQEFYLKPEEVIYFGDAITDLEAAKVCNVRFIGINGFQFSEDIEQYKSFTDLPFDDFNDNLIYVNEK